jgi:hypothetical protein
LRKAGRKPEILCLSGAPADRISIFYSTRFKTVSKHLVKMTSRPSKIGAFDCPFSWRTPGQRASRVRRGVAIITVLFIVSVASAQNRMSEFDVKAAYLFNFGKFVRFTPPDAVTQRQSFDFCIIGENPLEHTLDDLTANERLDGKPVRVVRLKTVGEAHGCSIAYISASEGAHVVSDLDVLHGQSVLTVSDDANFLRHGGMIQFVMVANHVRFAVNLEAVRGAQLSLGSELLRVALFVNGETPTGGLQ